VERLRATLMISVPDGKGPSERPSALHLDRRRAQGVAPSKLSQVPAGECNGIIDHHHHHHHHQMFLATRVFLADLGVTALDQ
jgi:hypothetical protein